MTERIFITGSSGFIGKRLTERLATEGYEIEKFPHSEWQNLSKHLLSFNPSIIYHLAAYGNHYHQKDPHQIYSSNVFNLLSLLEASEGLSYKALINTGSSSEYGRKDVPMKETNILEPETFYAASKAAASLLSAAWAKEKNQPVVTVRPFSVYGPGEDEKRFIPLAISCALKGKGFLLAPGVHDWIFVEDLVDGMILVAQNADKLKGRVVNIGTGIQHTNKEVVNILAEIIGKPIKTRKTEKMRNYDTTTSWVADNSLLISLGWKPKHTLLQGLKETVKYYERTLA